MLKVLFVCTGNICRSPTAEGVFRAMVERAGLAHRITADSCGTHDYHVGDPPDSRACAHALRRGYDIRDLRARMLERDDFERFDLLLALDRGHERILKRQAPPAAKVKVRLFMSYVPELRLTDVPDPYYQGAEAFDHALDLIERGCERLLQYIKSGLP
ncbi:MAG TPA: low molecular weight protein-tyrosine-phosphatase [Alphaproteobacteria bacterium]|nr:low molecular weight protein-tyrosine-phosphatase [Alphaproteobacteria bacterium]